MACLALLIGLAAAGLYGVVSLARNEPPSTFPKPVAGCSGVWVDDFIQDYASARAWREGINVYSPSALLEQRYLGPGVSCYQYVPTVLSDPHPPALILFGVPFTYLAYQQARLAWLALNASLLVLAVSLFLTKKGLRSPLSPLIGLAALAIPVVQKDLSLGQSNCLIVCLVVIGWRLLENKKDWAGGVLIGVAAALKIFPVLLVIPLIRGRRKRSAAGLVLSASALSGLSLALVGASSIHLYVSRVLTDNFRFWVGEPRNISAAATLGRWIMRTVWHPSAWNLPLLGSALVILFIGAAIMMSWYTPARLAHEPLWAATPWVVLAVPLAWEHYAVLVVPLVLAVIMRAYSVGAVPPIGWMVAAVLILVGVPPGLPDQIGHISLAAHVLGYGLPTYGLLVLGSYEWSHLRDPSPMSSR